MGFGILLLGYMTMFGVFPDLFMYNGYWVFIPIGGGLLVFAAFFKLREYNVYFRIMKYTAIVYILMLAGFAPFLIIGQSEEFMGYFGHISKIIRIFVLFVFHYIMLCGICALAKDVDNQKIYKSAKFNIYITYLYFGVCILGVFGLPVWYYMAAVILGLIYFFRVLLCIHSCFVRITYEGHDEERDEKRERKLAEKLEAKERANKIKSKSESKSKK